MIQVNVRLLTVVAKHLLVMVNIREAILESYITRCHKLSQLTYHAQRLRPACSETTHCPAHGWRLTRMDFSRSDLRVAIYSVLKARSFVPLLPRMIYSTSETLPPRLFTRVLSQQSKYGSTRRWYPRSPYPSGCSRGRGAGVDIRPYLIV